MDLKTDLSGSNPLRTYNISYKGNNCIPMLTVGVLSAVVALQPLTSTSPNAFVAYGTSRISPSIQAENANKDSDSTHSNESIDLTLLLNIDKIKKIAELKENWNGNGGKAFSKKSIDFFVSVLSSLIRQPQIAPTGRGSLYAEYRGDDNTILAYEINEGTVEEAYVPKGDYSLIKGNEFDENIAYNINEKVKMMYGLGQY